MEMMKLYFRIARSHWRSISLYMGIFIGCFAFFGVVSSQRSDVKMYEGVKPKIVLADQDHSEISSQLTSYLSEKMEIIEVGDSKTDREDALFFARVSAVVEIPEGFDSSFRAGNHAELNVLQRPDDANTIMIQQNVNSYLNTLESYKNVSPDASYKELHTQVMKGLNKKAEVTLVNEEEGGSAFYLRSSYYNYLSYILIVLCLMVVGLTMHSIYRSEILKRNLVSPMSSSRMNLQLVLANAGFGVILWAIMTVVVLLIDFNVMMTPTGLLYILNSFIFTMMSVALAFMCTTLISNLVHADDALNGITNILGLGCSFLGGAFVPQAMIADSVLVFSRFLPTYWYVKLSDAMSQGTELTDEILSTAMQCMGILILFTIAFLMIGLVVMRNKRSQNEIADTSGASQ